jgi:hypothetical protein
MMEEKINIKIEYMDEIFTPGENLGRFQAAGSHS